jgi:hypothetical protein
MTHTSMSHHTYYGYDIESSICGALDLHKYRPSESGWELR